MQIYFLSLEFSAISIFLSSFNYYKHLRYIFDLIKKKSTHPGNGFSTICIAEAMEMGGLSTFFEEHRSR